MWVSYIAFFILDKNDNIRSPSWIKQIGPQLHKKGDAFYHVQIKP